MPLRDFLKCWLRQLVAVVCGVLLVPVEPLFPQAQTPAPAKAQTAAPAKTPAPTAAAAPATAPAKPEAAPKIPNDQLDSLVAPIALYPDPLLSQVLMASTYPLEIIQLQQWLEKNKTLKDKALADAVTKQDWDPSIQALAGLPEVVKRLSGDIKWTTDLGDAFLAQQSDVMDAVQRMRKKAVDAGNLKSSDQQKVETKTVESKQVIVVEQANPQVVYVPSYNPTVVYGPPVYPYPPIYYPPPPPPGYYAAGMAISFGVGVAMGAMWSGGWCCGCGWGGNNTVIINNNNNFINNSNRVNNINRNNVGNNVGNRAGSTSNWSHNPSHRGGAPYSDRATANQFGGSARGDSLSSRQASARQNTSSRPSTSNLGSNRSGASAGNLSANRPSTGNLSTNRPSTGGDRVGNRSVSSPSRTSSGGAFGSSGMSGSSARASSSRGGGSFSRGGGGRRR